jgi:hypothetical protein
VTAKAPSQVGVTNTGNQYRQPIPATNTDNQGQSGSRLAFVGWGGDGQLQNSLGVTAGLLNVRAAERPGC